MSAAWGLFAGIFCAALTLVFLGIWAWAWLPRHRADFDALARLPALDADRAAGPGETGP